MAAGTSPVREALEMAEHLQVLHAAHCHVPQGQVCDECAWNMTEVERARGNVRKAVQALGAGIRHAALLEFATECEAEAALAVPGSEAHTELLADAAAARARALELEREAGV